MKKASFAVLACLVLGLPLAACDNSPRFDASSLPAYQKSLAAIKAKLSPRDQLRLDLALLTAATDNVALGLPPENPRAVVLSSLEGVANPLVFLDRLRPKIDGRTAAKVIDLTATDLDYFIARAGEKAPGADKTLAAISIDNAQYSWNRGKNFDEPVVRFSVANASPYAISEITVSGVLTTHGRVIAAGGGLTYVFGTPLQPGAQQSVTIRPGNPWGNKDLENVSDADFALKVSNIVDTGRRRLLYADVDLVEAMKRKRDFLRSN